MDFFRNKIVIVTGGGQGIGYEIARNFVDNGAVVFLNDLDQKLCDQAASTIDPTRERCISMPGDAGDVNFLSGLITRISKQFGKIDIVVANAGISYFGAFLSTSREDFEKVIRLNMEGTFFLLQQAAKLMIQSKTKGRLILMSSVTASRAHKDLAVYSMTKAGLEALARTLVVELSEFGITINAVAPGATLTERTQQDKNYLKTWSKLTPTGRPANTMDISNTVLFLASEKAAHITGQTITVDGGWTSISPGPEFAE